MFDFINIEVRNLLPKLWLENPILQGSGFPLEVIESTGEVLKKKRIAEYHGLIFKLLPSMKQSNYTMLLSGSIHKYKNKGKHNFDRFTFNDCIKVIEELFVVFGVDSTKAVLHSLEFGVNIKLPYPPQKLIQSIVVHKNAPYEAINKSRRNGVVCVRDGYEVKIYDKSFVCGLDGNIIRIEYHVSKMRELDRYGIRILSDLTDKAKASPLLELLIGVLNDTVFVPPDTDLCPLTKKQKINFHAMGKAHTWKDCTRKQRFDKKILLGRILKKCNAFDYQKDLQERVFEEWRAILTGQTEANKIVTFTPSFLGVEACKNVTFTSLEYRMQVLQNQFLKSKVDHEENCLKLLDLKRYCKTCGKEILGSRKNSLFCRKSTNPNAKQCRNKDSNRRRTLKAQIMRAKANNKFLRVTYKNLDDPQQSTFSDILHSSEIFVNRGLLNTIVSVEILSDLQASEICQSLNTDHDRVILVGKEAIEVLEELTARNVM